MTERNVLEVYLDNNHVGTLAQAKNHLVAFEYTDNWVQNGFSISPISLPLRKGVFIPNKYDPFDGLYGVFADSLPDGWGRLLVDRLLLNNGIDPATIGPITRLAIVGNTGMGALEYRPSTTLKLHMHSMSLDELSIQCTKMFENEKTECIDELFRLGGSSGGARPKVYYEIDGEEWIIKFPSSIDRKGIGTEEYQYSLCAKECNISMSDTRLLPSDLCDGYFASKRFDRVNGKKTHMVSAAGLLETSHRIPNLDYNILMQLTLKLTHSYEEVEKLFRIMCFNVYAHNRDDHSKNFSYLCKDGIWKLSPAYDLTYSNSIGGEHATTVNGNGTNPGHKDVLEVAKNIKLDIKKAELISKDIKEKVDNHLKEYLKNK